MSNDKNAIIMNAQNYMRLLNDTNEKGYQHPEIVAKMDSMTLKQIDILILYEFGLTGSGVRKIVDLWRQECEKFNGYFTYTTNEPSYDKIETHVFQKMYSIYGDSWTQISGDPIMVLDAGEKLLNILNVGDSKCFLIKNINNYVLHKSI